MDAAGGLLDALRQRASGRRRLAPPEAAAVQRGPSPTPCSICTAAQRRSVAAGSPAKLVVQLTRSGAESRAAVGLPPRGHQIAAPLRRLVAHQPWLCGERGVADLHFGR